mgnify:CR=1 FL=1
MPTPSHLGKNKPNKIRKIRPKHLLQISDGYDERITFFMPQAQGSGSLYTIESIILIKLMRLTNADYVFEFGTYKGLTTRILLENLPEKNIGDQRIYTLDLPNLEGVIFQGDDEKVALESIGFKRKYQESENKGIVKQIYQNSISFDGGKMGSKFQLIFIDGNHELTYVKKDTENAFKMMAEAPSCIAWHDYENPQFPELTDYINTLAEEYPIYHVENTMTAFYLKGVSIDENN